MGLKGKMIGQTEVKHSGVGDAFHDLISKTPHLVPTATPDKVQRFTELDGEIGVPGCKICYNYTHDGKEKVCIEYIDDIDEEKQSITMRVVEGDLMEQYRSFKIIYHVDTKGEDNLISWTLEYEKLKEDIPHPGTFLNFFLDMIEDIEAHHLKDA